MSVNEEAIARSAEPAGPQAAEGIDLFPPWAADTGMTALDVVNGFADKPELKERYEEWEANDPGMQTRQAIIWGHKSICLDEGS